MKIRILTPEKKVFDGEVEIITIPTRLGYISILNHHAPLVSAINPGEIKIKMKYSEEEILDFIKNQTDLKSAIKKYKNFII